MGRKLIRRLPEEREPRAESRKRLLAIVFLQHILLWSSAYVVASTAYLIQSGAVTRGLMPVAAVLMFAGSSTLMYVCLCNIAAWRSIKPSERSFMTSPARLQMLSKNLLRFVVTAWMVASGLVITFTVARHPSCLRSSNSSGNSLAIDVGTHCMVQRASAAASLLAMIAATGLIILILKTPDLYLAHLSGINKPPHLLPFALPYKPTTRLMFSELSFKCRSTSSFSSSSYTLTDPNSAPLYTLYPARPDKAYGLGIYAPKRSKTSYSSSSSSSTPFSYTSFLTPKPSLKPLRSQASLSVPRPRHFHSRSYPAATSSSSPLPPVPTYNPEKYKNLPALHYGKKSSGPPPPPRRAYTLKNRGSQGALRVVLRSPSCPTKLGDCKGNDGDGRHHDMVNVMAKKDGEERSKIPENNKNDNNLAQTQSSRPESLSSVYSRRLSGDDPEPPTAIVSPTTCTLPIPKASGRKQQAFQRQNPHIALRANAKPNVERYPLYPVRFATRPASGPAAGGRPPMRSSQRCYHPGSRPSSDNDNGRALVRNHFPGPGYHHVKRDPATDQILPSGRLPVARAMSGFGDVGDWSADCAGGDGGGVGNGGGSSWAARCGLPPLPVQRATFGGDCVD